MMMEAERREAIIREQARILTVQADRMRMEQEQVIRLEVHKFNCMQCVLYFWFVLLGHK
jgi:N6-adenosine-specific RNA methylase IME4